MTKYTRRELLETGIAGSLAFGVGRGLVQLPKSLRTNAPPTAETQEEALLRSVIDEIIPAGDSMPAASEVGGVDYLNRLMAGDRGTAEKLRAALAATEKFSQSRFKSSFVALRHEQRIEALTAFEANDRALFGTLRDYVYEAYYTNERIWTLVGYRNYPTTDAGPHMSAFDEQLLVNVQKRPKLYREI